MNFNVSICWLCIYCVLLDHCLSLFINCVYINIAFSFGMFYFSICWLSIYCVLFMAYVCVYVYISFCWLCICCVRLKTIISVCLLVMYIWLVFEYYMFLFVGYVQVVCVLMLQLSVCWLCILHLFVKNYISLCVGSVHCVL